MRIRLHFGSALEVQYSRRTFGIAVSRQLPAHKGRSLTRSGNILYNKIIQQYVDRYVRLQSGVTDRVEKAMISLDILHLFRSQYLARFLTRNDDSWTVADDLEIQKKISHALRHQGSTISNYVPVQYTVKSSSRLRVTVSTSSVNRVLVRICQIPGPRQLLFGVRF